MSCLLIRGLFNYKKYAKTRINNNYDYRGLIYIMQCVNKSSSKSDLGHTLILLEDGSNIRELPVIVRKVSSNSFLFCENKILRGEQILHITKSHNYSSDANINGNSIVEKSSNDSESIEMLDYLNKCYSARGIFAILETIPNNEVTPFVALQALKKIVTLDNNKAIRNTTTGQVNMFLENSDISEGLHPNETFTRTAVLAQLVDKILSTSDGDVLLKGFSIVNRDTIGKYIDEDNKNRFITEILCRVTDGKFNISQTCEAIRIFSDINPKLNDNADKLWVGITEKASEINYINLMEVFRCIPFLDKSQKIIISVVEKTLFNYWYAIQGHDVAEILVILKQTKSNSPRILSMLSQWVNKNIHTATEDDMIEIINGFCSLSFNNLSIQQALERYVKAKGLNIKNPTLMATIMDYCSTFRVRSPVLLQGSAEYIVVHGSTLSPVLLQRLFLPLGKLNYQPVNGINFWKILESALEQRFIQFRPEEAIDMLLNCVYLQKYPLNFVKKVFNPYFLDRLHSYKNKDILVLSRCKLQELDIAMTLESPNYHGPILPKAINSPPIWQDGRIKRIINSIRDVLSEIAGGANRVTYNMIPAKLPATDIYVIDVLILNKHFSLKMWPVNLERDYDMHTAVVMHSPEHYCSNGHYLIGRQEMRKRHFRHIGLRVVSLDLIEVAKLRVHPKALKNYIDERFKNVEPPFPKQKSI